MGKLRKQGNDFVLVMAEKEARELGLEQEKEYEISRAKQGIWVITEKTGQKKEIIQSIQEEARIFDLMKRKNLSDRVEGRFEKFLNERELAIFRELLAEEKIVAFKLNEKYKKAVYKIAPEKKKESEHFAAKEKQIEEYSLEQDGFLVVKNEERAKRLSGELQEDIKSGNIRGIRSFDSHFYIIENTLLEKYSDSCCAIIKASKSIMLPELAEKTGISKMLARIVCEFLKEDGEIIEKRKESYQLV